MFKKVLDALFHTSSDLESVVPAVGEDKPAPSHKEKGRVSLLDGVVMSPHDVAFLDHLFGDSSLLTETDPFSEHVAGQLERVLLSPQVMLNELPIMPASVSTLIAELENEEFHVDALIEVIESEPSMAADVIKLANSPRYKRSERSITDLRAAFMNIGSQGLIEGVIESYVRQMTPSFNVYWRQFGQNIWTHSVQTADFSKALVKGTELEQESATAYFVGLIRNLGRMLTFQIMIEAFRHVDPEASPNSSAFKKLVHGYEARLTFTVAHYWQLPDTVQVALAYQVSRQLKRTPLGVAIYEANYLSEMQCLLASSAVNVDMLNQENDHHLSTPNARQQALDMMSKHQASTPS
ncbi:MULTISPECIES: HDOD domain-containing protein [Vibrio]|uniref:HDOD domain-containing protein n=1 Tax=Vibrio TaxID=662 RepID=UPI0001B941AC|nr:MULTISPECIES: HDOD domain-containing protein [Vibrio]EEX34529.1 hypothetical protein VIC_001329 [Vibrio coralliilyticus ATCC BAA-450]MDE3898573.1 HDOD domain-containing protein [Vibrio sp. CC007]NOI59173.1 HDOD domain-containing protein [Vibrio coralliilyticus]PAT66226.1 HDOD domain-containing protein [Vibrio coralliilyticus]